VEFAKIGLLKGCCRNILNNAIIIGKIKAINRKIYR
jgi:hypothetical protein